jgi:hypothetical protein
MFMNAESPGSMIGGQSRIRTKTNVEVEVVLLDGTTLHGSVFIGLNERVQELLNDSKPYFPLRMPNNDLLMVNKNAAAIVKPLDAGK